MMFLWQLQQIVFSGTVKQISSNFLCKTSYSKNHFLRLEETTMIMQLPTEQIREFNPGIPKSNSSLKLIIPCASWKTSISNHQPPRVWVTVYISILPIIESKIIHIYLSNRASWCTSYKEELKDCPTKHPISPLCLRKPHENLEFILNCSFCVRNGDASQEVHDLFAKFQMEGATKTGENSIWWLCCRPAKSVVHLKKACDMAIVLNLSASNADIYLKDLFL